MQRNQITPQKDGREGIEPAIPTAEAIPQPTMQLSLSDWICERRPLQIGFIVLLIVAALVSEFALRPHFEQVETWGSTIEVIDARSQTSWRSRPRPLRSRQPSPPSPTTPALL